MYLIYKITNINNGKSYIGKTSKTLEERLKEHIKSSKRVVSEIRPLYRAFNKYGIESFVIELIEEVECNISSIREIFWIDFYNTYKNGYNATKGGDGKSYVDKDIVIESYKRNQSIKEVVKEIGVTEKTIRKILIENNIDRPNRSEIAKKMYAKTVLQFDLEGNFIKEFDSATEASIEVKGDKSGHSNIANCCKGKTKQSYGFIWKFK